MPARNIEQVAERDLPDHRLPPLISARTSRAQPAAPRLASRSPASTAGAAAVVSRATSTRDRPDSQLAASRLVIASPPPAGLTIRGGRDGANRTWSRPLPADVTLNPAGLALFTDWVTTLPPRPLPRTVTPVAREYHLGYVARRAEANHLEFGELTGALSDTAAITVYGPRGWKQHEQERLAAAASQPLARIARLCWPDPSYNLRDIEGFHQKLRPACRRCTARYGITGPVPCQLPPHQALCRRHRLWTGPAARTHAGQLDISPFPEILRAHRRHLAQLHRHPWQLVDTATGHATTAIYRALRDGAWIPGQQHRMRQLAPATWQHELATELGARPGQPDHRPGHPAIEIAIYPDIIGLAARNLRTRDTVHGAAA